MSKNRVVGAIALVVLLALLLWFWLARQGTTEASPPVTLSTPSQSLVAPISPPQSSSIPNQISPEVARKRSEAQVQNQRQVFDLLFLTPITFYGKVVDTTGAPIAGAQVEISAADSIGGNHSQNEKTTDNAGLFSISTHGMGLVVNVSKDGYYRMKESAGVYDYAYVGQATNPHPDPHNPAIFILRKKGETEPLIKFQRYVKIPKDGTPTRMNLTTGTTFGAATGDIQVEEWTNDQAASQNANHHYDWHCKINIPGGGLISRTGEFDFIAPTDGYQNEDDLSMSSSAIPWDTQVNREYFLILTSGEYARISFTMHAGGSHYFDITSYLNPVRGHRNLEYDPAKQINK